MTCIVGIETPKGVYIGGDSAGVGGWGLTIRADEKVFEKGPYVFGFCGSFRMGQLLRYAFDAPVCPEGANVMNFMCTTFIDAVRACLKKGGYARMKDCMESAGTFLVGYRNQLFMIGADYQVGRASVGYDAVGCGEGLAIGALHILQDIKDIRPEHKVVAALEASAAHCSGVAGPFIVVDNCPGELLKLTDV